MEAMVVCPEPLAAEAGIAVIERGGNAIDAAVAASFTQAAVNPPLCGIGGSGCMNIYEAASGRSTIIHFMAPAGSLAKPDIYADIFVGRRDAVGRYEVEGYVNQMGYKSICVPTFIRGVEVAHRRFGTMPWGELLQPAIRYAKEGFEVYPYIEEYWGAEKEASVVPELDPVSKMRLNEACTHIYLKNGRSYQVGEVLVQTDLARTLEKVAEGGGDAFYQGAIARQIAEDVQAHGGYLTYEDLANYQPQVYEQAVTGTYKGLMVTTDYPPATGVQFVTLFHILDELDLSGYTWNSVEYIDLISRVLHQGFEDRRRYYADPNFNDVPVDMLSSRGHADELRENVLKGVPARSRVDTFEGTTQVSIIDQEGNAVSFTHSTGSGAGVVTEGLGFIYNNMMGPFHPLPGHHDSVAPGKRAVAGCGPLIFLEDGKVQLAIGSPAGSRKTSAVVQTVLNVFEHDMTMQEAVTVPRFHSEEAGVMYLEPAIDEETAQGLENVGYEIRRSAYGGRVQAVLVGADGRLQAGADPRGGGGVGKLE